jgi:aminobenzoyl-glutamate utilization protein B
MRITSVIILTLLTGTLLDRASAADPAATLDQSVQRLADDGWQKAQQIWAWAEPGYQETKSSRLLADWLEAGGFRVQRGIAGMPTAFLAEYGTGKPVLAILGEFDALPGLSQQAVPVLDPRPGNSYGHGCGHHLFGTASAMAALALAEQIQAGELTGTVRYYGCPAEEGGSAKAFMVRDGLFNGVDAALHWHPSSMNSVGEKSSLARIAVRFRFHGKSAHAAAAPDQGRSALDAVEFTNFGVQLLREHIPVESRIHYVITAGGQAPNVVPDFAEVYYYVRHPSSEMAQELYQRVLKCAQAGALATETRLEVVPEGGIVEILPNAALAEVTRKNLEQLNGLKYTAEEVEFALKLQATLPSPKPLDSVQLVTSQAGEIGKGSTDVGDVSWVVPTGGFNVACWVPGTPGHSWQAVACGGTTIARQGMILAARVLALSGRDIMVSPEVLAAAAEEFSRRRGPNGYRPLIAPDQQPPLDYRKSPMDRNAE